MGGAGWRDDLYAALTPRTAAVAVIVYCAVHAAITLASGPALALDDVKLNVLTQSWRPGYLPDNPPLFEWTLILAQGLFGPSLASFVAVKYFFLIAAAAFTFLALREATGDARTGAAGALLLPLIPQVGWAYHQTLTHSAALVAAIAFFWFALIRIERRQTCADFIVLGIAIGTGALAKYAFLPAALIALAVAFARPSTRRALLRPELALAAVIAGVIASPHLFWLAQTEDRAAAVFQERLIGPQGHWTRVGDGLPSAVWAIAGYFAPLLGLLFIADRRFLRALRPGRDSLLFQSAAAACVALPAAVILLGLSNFQERYALAFLFPGFLWLVAAASQLTRAPQITGLLAGASAAFSILAMAARMIEVAAPGEPFCGACRQHIPYAYLHDALAERIGAGATLVAFDDTTAGNLRRLFPKNRVLSAHQPFYTPPARGAGDCYFIWSTDVSPPPSQSAIDQLDGASFLRAGGKWRRQMNGEMEFRETWWTIAAVDPFTPIRTALCRD